MLRTAASVFMVLALSIAGGGASVWYALDRLQGLDARQVGQWTARPLLGSSMANPYVRAAIARDAVLPLGPAEGIAFKTARDASGKPLRRRCGYRVVGSAPVARFWTLHVAGTAQDPPAALSSRAVLRRADNMFEIAVSPLPAPGNWLRVTGTGPMELVLTFYDSPTASQTGFGDVRLPRVEAEDCRG